MSVCACVYVHAGVCAGLHVCVQVGMHVGVVFVSVWCMSVCACGFCV